MDTDAAGTAIRVSFASKSQAPTWEASCYGNGIGMVGTPEPEAVLLFDLILRYWRELEWYINATTNYFDDDWNIFPARLFMSLIVDDWNIFPLEIFWKWLPFNADDEEMAWTHIKNISSNNMGESCIWFIS